MSKLIKIAILAVILSLTIQTQHQEAEAPQKPVLEQIEPNITLIPELIPICACESTGKATGTPTHYDKNGNVLHGKINPQDIGMCQINEHYNGKQAESMGLNIYKEKDNIIFANYMYKTQGSQPGNWSRECWGAFTK